MSTERAEELGIRVRIITGLAEGALYFRKQGLLLLDENLNQDEVDGVVDGVIDEFKEGLSLWDTL